MKKKELPDTSLKTSFTKEQLEARELELKVEELEFKVIEFQKPWYQKIGTVSSLIAVLIALGSVVGQNILSEIKRAEAKRDVRDAADSLIAAHRKMEALNTFRDSAQRRVESLDRTVYVKQKELEYLQRQQDSAHDDIEKMKQLSNASSSSPQAKKAIDQFADRAQKQLSSSLPPPRLYAHSKREPAPASYNSSGSIEQPRLYCTRYRKCGKKKFIHSIKNRSTILQARRRNRSFGYNKITKRRGYKRKR